MASDFNTFTLEAPGLNCDAPALPCRLGLRLFLPLPVDTRLWGSICLCLLFSVQPVGGAELQAVANQGRGFR